MFGFRRFSSAALFSAAPSAAVTTSNVATFSAAATLASQAAFQSSISNPRRNYNDNYSNNRRDGNNNSNASSSSYSSSSNNNSGNNIESRRPVVEYRPSARWTAYTRGTDAFLSLTHVVDTASSGAGYRFLVTFPQDDCTCMDIQYAQQVYDKGFDPNAAAPAAEGKTEGSAPSPSASTGGRRGVPIFGLPVSQLAVRVYPLQMAKIVAVLEGKSAETVIASRLAIGTLKKSADGTFVYTVQTRLTRNDSSAPTAIEAVLTPVHAFMLEKFFSKMLVAGFDPSRDPMNAGPSSNIGSNNDRGNNSNNRGGGQQRRY